MHPYVNSCDRWHLLFILVHVLLLILCTSTCKNYFRGTELEWWGSYLQTDAWFSRFEKQTWQEKRSNEQDDVGLVGAGGQTAPPSHDWCSAEGASSVGERGGGDRRRHGGHRGDTGGARWFSSRRPIATSRGGFVYFPNSCQRPRLGGASAGGRKRGSKGGDLSTSCFSQKIVCVVKTWPVEEETVGFLSIRLLLSRFFRDISSGVRLISC